MESSWKFKVMLGMTLFTHAEWHNRLDAIQDKQQSTSKVPVMATRLESNHEQWLPKTHEQLIEPQHFQRTSVKHNTKQT